MEAPVAQLAERLGGPGRAAERNGVEVPGHAQDRALGVAARQARDDVRAAGGDLVPGDLEARGLEPGAEQVGGDLLVAGRVDGLELDELERKVDGGHCA